MSTTITVGSQHRPSHARLWAAGAIVAIAAGGTAIAVAAVDDSGTTTKPPAITAPAAAESHSHPDLTKYRQQPVNGHTEALVSRFGTTASEPHDGLRLYHGRR